MGRRILVVLLGAIAVSLPQWGFALGLGEITLKSALNQPLRAEIKLLEVRDLTENEILVGLASAADFDRVGVDRPYFLTDLKFRVSLGGASGPVIVVTSSKVVREPYLNFVLQTQWPSGRLLREYTLLMDLPVFSGGDQAQPVAPAQSQPFAQQPSSPQPSRDYNPRSSFDEAPARPRSASTVSTGAINSAYSGGDSYTVQANDTLWEIARQVRPDAAVSIQQTMLAMQRINPEAFIKNNINLLKKGQILRIPDREEIGGLSKSQAVNEVAAQNARWSGRPLDSGFVAGEQLDASRGYSSAQTTSDSTEGRVKLSSPEEYSSANEGRGSGAGMSSQESLENELAITLEQLDKSERENSDLRSRVASLEEQISTMERMLDITNEEMRALELAAEQRKTLEAEAQSAGSDINGDSVPDSGMDGEPVDLSDVGAGMATDETVEITPEPTAEPTPEPTAEPTPVPTPDPSKVVIPAAPQKTIVDHLLDNIIYIALGLIVVLGGVFAFLKFRNREDDDELGDDFLQQPLFDEPVQESEPEPETEEFDLDDYQEDALEPVEEAPAAQEEVNLAEPETEDVVGEADIYIAYGKYDQAEEMLTKAIAREPSNPKIRAKLLEVYSAQQDVARFDPQYAALLALGDNEAAERAAHLRESIAGAAPFDPGLYAADTLGDSQSTADSSTSGGYDELSLDLESDADSDEEFSIELPEASLQDDDEEAFTLDLGEDTAEAESDDDFELSFDLGDGDDSAEEDVSLDADEFDLSLDDDDVHAGDAAESEEFDLGDLTLDSGDDDKSFDTDGDDLDLDLSSSADDDLDALLDPADIDDDEDELVSDGDDDGFSLEFDDIDDALDSEDLSKGATGRYDLSELDSLSEDDGLELDPDENAQDSVSAEADTEDDLDLGSDFDLSALDEELSALTSDLDVENADLDDLELPSAGDDDAGDGMEEPVTDFEDLESDFDMSLEGVSDDLESELELGLESDEDDSVEAEPAAVDPSGDESEDDKLFNEALADVPPSDFDYEIPDVDPEGDDDLGFLSDSDETATKLDLARAYIDMGDAEGAKDILDEIVKEGNPQQRQEAQNLLSKV